MQAPLIPHGRAELSLLRSGWGDFLERFHWSHFGTLTFRQERSQQSAVRDFRRWVRRVEQRSGGRVDWMFAVEPTYTGAAHVHCLLNTTKETTVEKLRDAWQAGFSKIVRYDRARGARHYLMKNVGTDGLLEYEISSRLTDQVGYR